MRLGEVIGARRPGGKALFLLLAAFGLLLGASSEALAIDCVADAGGTVDGFVNYPVPPAQIQIDGPCTIRNYTAANPLTSNISWFGSLPPATLLIFDNVVHTGNMACNLSAQGNFIWFVNSASTTVQNNCINLLIAVEKIDKQNPPGPPFVTIGVPFTWTLRIPVLFDPASGTVINNLGSINDLHSITVVDDLSIAATTVDLTFLGYTATWVDDGTPVTPINLTQAGKLLTFDGIPVVNAGRQFDLALTVVLNNNPAVNTPNKSFINTARWEFGRSIGGVDYAPLPGENGISPPLTISAPDLIMDKTGPATMNLGQWGTFSLNLLNTGNIDAWDVHLEDVLPRGGQGGMCNIAPQILGARVFANNGINFVPGKGPLVQGTDYTFNWTGPPQCRLDLTMQTPQARIGPSERLIVLYRTQLDANTNDGASLTNFAGAIQWFNGPSSAPNRVVTNNNLSNGTVGFADFQDAHTVTVDLFGYFFEKTVQNLTSGANPATTATPGDTLRYTLRFQTTDQPLADFRIDDVMDALNAPPAFAAGTLAIVSAPPGADTSNTTANGGPSGTGVLDVRNLSLPLGSQLSIVFDITLRPALANGSVVSDQASFRQSNGALLGISDDPVPNGQADPFVAGDEDPTRLTIVSAPAFRIQKISTDLTGDPNVLLAGETLRYTITVVNIGTENGTNVVLRDAVPPANTAYVAGSTTLNGAPVADVAGLSPLVNGLLIHPPSDPVPGSMPADAAAPPANVATITFDVVVSPSAPDGTVISNQGFVTAGTLVDLPSDDPGTPAPNDPTRDVVGNFPLVYATKTVALSNDLGTAGIVDPNDRLIYTITVQNTGTVAATGVVLTDGVPANTTYFANSTRLNGLPVGQPDGGVPPLASGINISSSDLTPPLPGPGGGTISPGQTATLQFELTVDPGTPAGTLITNQAVVDTVELPNLLTDGDGNPGNGAQPTVVVVGAVQALSITKQVTVVGGGPALAGGQLDYVVTVTNIAPLPATNVVITDTLPAGQLALVPGSALMNGLPAGVSVAGSTITANYAAAYGALAPGGVVTLRFRATLNPALVNGTVVTNTGVVSWNNPAQTASAGISIVVGTVPGLSQISGSAWHDADFDDVRDAAERRLAGWTVELVRNGVLWNSTLTDANGDYRFVGVDPNDTNGTQYEVRFVAPGAGPNTAKLGRAASPFTNGLQRISAIVVPPGLNVQGLNLPIDPNGVVYNSMARIPVPGAALRLLDAASGTPLPANCFGDPGDNGAQQGQITLADGWYKFDLNFSDPACPIRGDYLIDVTPPAGAFVAGTSQIIPPASGPAPPPYLVPSCPGGIRVTVGAVSYCEVQPSELAPPVSVPPAGVIYRVRLLLDSSPPDSSQLYNNHIPIDPQLNGALAIAKTTSLVNVSRGQLVPYTITVNNLSGTLLTSISLLDRIPAGFAYVRGSALLDGQPVEPAVNGRDLTWTGLDFTGTQVRTVKLLLAVGAGVSEGEFVNRAQALNGLNGLAITGEATATVRVVPDPTIDCTDVTGKVWNDANRNKRQDEGEEGLSGVRLATPTGLVATTDAYGRYHITCAIVPNENRGSNFVLKLDDRTLPSGFRMSTDQVAIARATRGKALKVNFGASIHHVVSIDLSDAAFEPGGTGLRAQWQSRVDLLIAQLQKAPSVLRLSYLADTEEASLVSRRIEAFKRQVTDAWSQARGGYRLDIEPEVFWRRGAPPKKPEIPPQKEGTR